MKKNLVTIAVILMFALTIFSGCTEQQSTKTNTNNGVPLGSLDVFSVDSTGGQFSVLQNTVEVNVYEGSVSEPVNITVESIANPASDSSQAMLSCYEFGPEGLTFERPIDVNLHYNLDDIPQGVKETVLKVYVLNGNSWEPIEGSYVNQILHYATASVSHFSTIGCGANSSGGGGNSSTGGGTGDNSTNGSAQYWFKADFYTYCYKTPRLVDWADSDTYYCGVSAYWDPVPYVHYYQVKLMFNGNEPANYGWSCDFRSQGGVSCNNRPLNRVENYIYQIGGDPTVDGYLGSIPTGELSAGALNETTGEVESFVFARIFPEQKHGLQIVEVHDEVEDYEGLSGTDIAVLQGQMEEFVLDYSNGWELWVRGVTETIG